MENILFIYNISITVLFAIILSGYFILYKKTQFKEYLYTFKLFILLLIENSIVYISEFSMSFEKLYNSSTILYIIIYVLLFSILSVSRFLISILLKDRVSNTEKYLSCLIVVTLITIDTLFTHKMAELAIYVSFYLAIIYLVVRIYLKLKVNSIKYIVFLSTFIIISISGIVDSFLYFTLPGDLSLINEPSLLEYRNIAFDIMKLIISILSINKLKTIFGKLIDNKDIDNDKINKHIQDFCVQHGLTSRQEEIIKYILQGCSNKDISLKLNISEGTVKTHIYNIFKRVDISSRNQLLKKIMY